jgi:hypothetical protein
VASPNLTRSGGGLASIAAGVLLVVGHVLNLGGDLEYGTVLGSSLVLAAHVLLVFALLALYAAQADRAGILGSLGMVLSVIGTTLASGVVLVEIAGASGAEVEAVARVGVSGALSSLGGLAFLIGLILFGMATMRAGVFHKWAGLLLIIGDVVFGAGSFAGPLAPLILVLGALITCSGFSWLGLDLLSGSDSSSRRPARVGK